LARATFARLTPAALSGEWPGGAAAEAEGAIFSSDGQFVFISNSAELGMPDKGLHWTHKGGYISKLAVQPDGSLNTINEKLITGLTGPLGMPVIPVATEKFPSGTIFVIEAWAPLAEADTVWHVATVAVRQAGRFASDPRPASSPDHHRSRALRVRRCGEWLTF